MEKILVLDDSESIRLLLTAELRDEGFKVIAKKDICDALNLIRMHEPDLIIMEIEQGGVSGLDLLLDIRNDFYDLPVIIWTRYPEFKSDLRAIAADYYVLKSSDLEELKDKVSRSIESGKPFYSCGFHSGDENGRTPGGGNGKADCGEGWFCFAGSHAGS